MREKKGNACRNKAEFTTIVGLEPGAGRTFDL